MRKGVRRCQLRESEARYPMQRGVCTGTEPQGQVRQLGAHQGTKVGVSDSLPVAAIQLVWLRGH